MSPEAKLGCPVGYGWRKRRNSMSQDGGKKERQETADPAIWLELSSRKRGLDQASNSSPHREIVSLVSPVEKVFWNI